MQFVEYLEKRDASFFESIRRTGIAHWAYPDGYVRSHYTAGYFMPTAAEMGPKVDEKKVDHGQFHYKHHEKIV